MLMTRAYSHKRESASMPHAKSAGFSMVELMVSITVGLIVMAGVIGLFVNTVKASSDAIKMTRLNQELRAAMDVMTRDIRRSGYWANASSTIGPPATSTANNNPFDIIDVNTTDGVANSCITYSYDADSDGDATVPDDEMFGFRLKTGAVQSREDDEDCDADEDWEDITDKQSVLITNLEFRLTHPKVLTVTPSTGSQIKIREVTLTLKGELKSDSTVTREIKETVRVRSDKWAL